MELKFECVNTKPAILRILVVINVLCFCVPVTDAYYRFVSCYLEYNTGETGSVGYTDDVSQIATRVDCQLKCLSENQEFGYWGESGVCLCGSRIRDFDGNNCVCPNLTDTSEPLPGSLLCGFQYVNNTFSTQLQDQFEGVRPFSSEEDAHLSITFSPDVTLSEYTWDFDDGSVEIVSPNAEIYHGLYLAGEYHVSYQSGYGNATFSSAAPLQIHDPIRTNGIRAPVYANIHEQLDLGVVLHQGTAASIVWHRETESGRQASSLCKLT